MNPTIPPLWLECLNRGVQDILSVDPDTAREIGQLQGKVFCIEMTLPPAVFYLIPKSGGILLAQEADVEPDVTLTGPMSTFLRLARQGSASRVLTDGQVIMQGDVEAGQRLQRILARFDFDWEELIARRLGDLPARQLGNVVRGISRWAGEMADLSRENVADLLTEEQQLAVSPSALRRLTNEVARLREDTDRLAQRLDRLAAARQG